MNSFTFILPSKTYIKKFVTALYGDPIRVDLNTDIGFIVLNVLASRFEAKMSRGKIDLFNNRYNDKIIFKIPFHYFSITKKEVSPCTFVLLNRFFQTLFEKEFNRFMYHSKQTGSNTIKKNIELFLEQYNIELDTDITYDAVKKSEYRYRKTLQKEFSRNLSPAPDLRLTA